MKRFAPPVLFLAALLFSLAAAAQDIASFEKRITTKTLPNGLTVIVMERPEAPVFSFNIHVDAGSAQDPQGKSGLAHMFEHMAFKGTPNIGSKNYAKEKVILEQLEKAYLAYDRENSKRVNRDEKKIAALDKAWKKLAEEAFQYVKGEEFSQIIETNGGVGLNAGTGADSTNYFYSMPANLVEMWAYLESERFLHPVYREFYKERDVVVEERRLRTDSNPVGRLVEQVNAAAYTAHPYQRPGVGWYSEITEVTATDAEEFFKTYYTPANMVVTIVGDVKTTPALAIIERYFGRLPKAPKPQELRTAEPEQNGARTVVLRDASQPVYIEVYHRPSYLDPDDAVYDAIQDLLSNGRTSRLYRSLVRDKKISLQSGGFSGFPGTKYPSLFLFYSFANQGKTNQEQADAIRAEIERLKHEDISDDELKMIKTRAKADLIRGLGDNQGLATQLGAAQTAYGDWRELFHQVERIEKVTKADIRRVANKTFVESNRTVGMIENIQQASAPQKGAK